MILSGRAIEEQVQQGNIIIDPFNHDQVNPNSYNLRLSDELVVYTDSVLDMKRENHHKTIRIPAEGLVLEPNTLYLGRTIEYIQTDHFIMLLEGRSSIARLGLFVHITAGLGNIGSSGNWTLELVAVQPLRIYSGIQLCQLIFHTIEGSYDLYNKKYKESKEIQPSMLYKELK
jgi:dCTP deaminase